MDHRVLNKGGPARASRKGPCPGGSCLEGRARPRQRALTERADVTYQKEIDTEIYHAPPRTSPPSLPLPVDDHPGTPGGEALEREMSLCSL